jgi:hypothetical protein
MRDLERLPIPKPVSQSSKKARSRRMENGVAKILREAGDPTAKRVALSGAIKDGSLPICDVGSLIANIECKNLTPIQGKTERYVRFDLNWLTKLEEETKASGLPGVAILQPKGADLVDAVAIMRTGALLTLLGKLAQYQRGENT